MKRRPIAVRWSEFDLDRVSDEISHVARGFADYLGSFIPESGSRSKHAIMGPVAKILARARSSMLVPEDLLGLAIRAHEQTSRMRLGHEARIYLENAVEQLVELLHEVPEASRSEVLARIDHSVYWLRRKAELQRWENDIASFGLFLRERYESDDELAAAWGEEADEQGWTLQSPPYPSRALSKRDDQIGIDVSEYWEKTRGER